MKYLLITLIAIVSTAVLSTLALSKPPVVVASQLDDRLSYVELINDYRASKGLSSLSINYKLDSSAQLKANDMRLNQYFEHTSPAGITPWHWFEVAGYDYTKSGENLSRCYDSPTDTVEAWLDSPTHKANIMGDYTETGFGSYYDGDCLVVVNHFGKR